LKAKFIDSYSDEIGDLAVSGRNCPFAGLTLETDYDEEQDNIFVKGPDKSWY
jgi:hypothetical protein